ncbi:MAG: nucleotide sugar dehydrogenase [Haloferacaceae archaeon]
MEISVVGLGRLGSSFAASVANSGIPVRGVDIDPEVVRAINTGRSPFAEPRLDEYLRNAGDRLTATTDATDAIPGTDATFVLVNTYAPDVDGYSLTAVERATRDLGRALPDADGPHLVVLRSTVMPGDTESKVVGWLEESSGRTVGDDLHLCYWPELTALGAIIDSMESPAFRLIGEHTPAAGDRLEAFVEEWTENEAPLVRTDLTSAEVAKMGINTYVATKMSFANNLSHVCEGIGADVDEVTDAMAHDPRIDGGYFTAGVRYGGPCFPHDNDAFEALADRAGVEAPIARAADAVNRTHTAWILDAVADTTPAGGTVAVLGLTYKPGVPVVEESQGMQLLRTARDEYDVIAYDAIGVDAARAELDGTGGITYTDRLETAVADADTAILTLRDHPITDPSRYRDVTLVDPWRAFDADDLADSVVYRPLGRGGG